MKDFVTIATHLGVSHLLMLSQTEKNVILRIARSPSGPTLHFRINQFMLPSQIKAMQKRPFDSAAACKFGELSPLIILLLLISHFSSII